MSNINKVIKDAVSLYETYGKTAVVGWGRMNPPTIGHEKLVNDIIEVARKQNATPLLFLSKSEDPKNNPLKYNDKLMLARTAFGSVIQKTNARTIIEVFKELTGKYQTIILIVGSDRVDEFQKMSDKYNHKEFDFDQIHVLSAGERDPDSSDSIQGISASRMRQFVVDGNIRGFTDGLPKKLRSDADHIFTMVMHGMNMFEETQLDEFVLSIAQRRKRALNLRKYKAKIAVARRRMMKRMATPDALQRRARHRAIISLRKRVAGQKGLDYQSLSAGEKITIDKNVEKRKGAIGRIAQRLLPQLRRDDLTRLAKVHTGTPTLRPDNKPNNLQVFRKVNEDFENLIEKMLDNEYDVEVVKERKKKWHMMHTKEGSVKLDKRFKIFKKEPTDFNNLTKEDLDILETLEVVYEDLIKNTSKIEKSLQEKSEKSGIPLDALWEAFNIGLTEFTEGSKTPSQTAFDSVNAYIATISEDKNWVLYDEELNEAFGDLFKKKQSFKADVADYVKKNKVNLKFDHKTGNTIADKDGKPWGVIEKVGSQFVVKTPHGETVKKFDGIHAASSYLTGNEYAKTQINSRMHEEFELLEDSQCALISQKDMRELEKFGDELLSKYGIDIEFTKHFGDRMSDDRNNPCITVGEIKDFFRKIYNNQGAKIKGNRGIEAVLKDMQKSLNMPVIIDKNSKGEVEVRFKTIMRKKNFYTPDKTISF